MLSSMFDLPHSNFEGGSFLTITISISEQTEKKQTYIAKYLHGQPNNDIPEMNLSFENLLLNLVLL